MMTIGETKQWKFKMICKELKNHLDNQKHQKQNKTNQPLRNASLSMVLPSKSSFTV